MVAVMDILVKKISQSKINEIDFDNLPFGKYFTDHMLEVDYENGEWKTPVIRPYQPLLLEPSPCGVALRPGDF